MKLPALFSKKGQAMIEAAITSVFLLVTLFILGDLLQIGYNWMALQHAVGEGSRYGSLGNTNPACTSGDIRACSIEQIVIETAAGLGLDNVTVAFGNSGAGGSMEFFTLTASRQLTLQPFTGLFLTIAGNRQTTFTITAGTVIRNEPF